MAFGEHILFSIWVGICLSIGFNGLEVKTQPTLQPPWHVTRPPLTPRGGNSETLRSSGCPVARRRNWSRGLQPQRGGGDWLRRLDSLSLWERAGVRACG